MRKEVITQLRILKMSGIKPNFSELARQYGIDRRTVKKYYDGYKGKLEHRNKSSKLDKYYETIKTKLSLRGANVRAVYEYILDEVDADIETYSNFSKYVKSRGLKPQKTEKGHPRYETAMGVQAQVDWKAVCKPFDEAIGLFDGNLIQEERLLPLSDECHRRLSTLKSPMSVGLY